MGFRDFCSKAVFFSLIFFSVVIVSSNIIGFFWLNSQFIFLFSLVVSAVAFRKFYFSSFLISKEVFLLALLLAVALAYPVLALTPFFPASADAATTTAVRVLGDRIPLTYEPFAELSFAYQIGFPLLVNVFSDLVPQFPDYLWAWLLSLVSGALQIFAVYLFSKEFFGKERTAFLASALFLGTKLVFENFYVGEYAWLLATAFTIFSLYFLMKKNPVAFLLFPAVLILHPAIALNAFILFFVFRFFFRGKNWAKTDFLGLGLSVFLAIPAILLNYFPILQNLLFSRGGFLSVTGAFDFFYYLRILPLWLGLVPFLIFVSGLIFFTVKKIAFTREHGFFLAVFLAGFVFYFIFAFLDFVLTGRVVELMLLAVLFLAASFLERIESEYRFDGRIVLCIILFLSAGFFFSSGLLNHYRGGSKISMEEADFAREFFGFDPALSNVLVLSEGSGKIAEFSNKIPFALHSAHTITTQKFLYSDPAEFEKIECREKIRESIIDGSCPECISDVDVDYIVVNTVFSDKKFDYPVVFSYADFVVYRKE